MNTLLGFPATAAFGGLLRQWRTARRLSQLALATEAGISTRHLSFLETGRAQPSREMVQLLAGMLDVPLGERNVMLVAAGYAPLYGERPLAAPELDHVRHALHFVLRQQEPYPAFVLDADRNIVMRNEASHRIFALFRGPIPADAPPINVMRTVFDPAGVRRFLVNWEEVAQCQMEEVHREIASGTASEALIALRDELLAYPGVPSRLAIPDPLYPTAPMVTTRFTKDDLSLAFFSMLTTLANPRDITLQRLRIECFYPADAITEEVARRMAALEPTAA